jgi:hypothetical protein
MLAECRQSDGFVLEYLGVHLSGFLIFVRQLTEEIFCGIFINKKKLS